MRYAVLACLCLLIFAGVSTAQVQRDRTASYVNQQRQVEEEVRQQLDRDLPLTQKVLFDWGGWFGSYLFMFDDAIKNRTLRRQDVRLWGSLNADQGIHQAYIRLKLSYDDFNHNDSYTGNDDDFEGPNLDRGWYQLDLAKLLRKHGGVDLPIDLSVKAGRDYVMFGTGYALSMPLDAVQITTGLGDIKIDTLLGKTISSYDNLDTSRPDPSRSDRCFYGVQARYTGFQKHEPFIYYFEQNDRQHDGWPFLWKQKWDYDSKYLGFGSTGEITPTLRYSGEFVFQQGRSYADKQWTGTEPIDAYGWDLELIYTPRWSTRPRFSLEYMFAGGDADRLLSPTNSVIGNLAGTSDKSFNAFGYRNTGLALAPDLSNLHIWRLGGSFFPLDKHSSDWLRKFELGTDFFLYHKNRTAAAISDPFANTAHGFVGWEMDYYINWRLTSDLSWTIRYGIFFPGSAYTNEESRNFFLTGFTWSF
ncbi:MAG: alginate export family protein [Phycisphaerae bacterium]|nr:alginate export family protein [Phycisphaerae bacterium]